MWELICHQTYDWHGLPIDRSVYDNHGSALGVDTLPDGIAPGSGAVRFASGSGISVPLRSACRSLRAVRVECTVRLTDPTPARRTLIDCAGSFKFFIFSSGLWAVHAVQPSSAGIYFGVFGYPGFHNDGLSTVSDAVGGQSYQVPLGQWVNLAFEHDGLAAMRLYADGQMVAQRQHVLAGIRDAGASGVRIGNSAGGVDENLGGDIDEIKLWRRDPRAMGREFAQRPLDESMASCWHDFLEHLDELLRADPECARRLLGGLREAVERASRAIAVQGPGAVRHHLRFCEEYRRLWRQGQIAGPDMASLVDAWVAWMRSLGVAPEADAQLQALINSECFRRLWATSPGLDCDAAFAGMMRLFIEASRARPSASAAGGRHGA